MKRILSIMLVLCMTLTCITPALAEEATSIETVEATAEEAALEETEVLCEYNLQERRAHGLRLLCDAVCYFYRRTRHIPVGCHWP